MGISLNSFLGKLYFTTLNYQHFFNPPPKLKKVSIDPLILSYCTTVTPCGQNRVIIDGIVYHVTRMWSQTHQNNLYQFDFFLNPEMPLSPLNKIWNALWSIPAVAVGSMIDPVWMLINWPRRSYIRFLHLLDRPTVIMGRKRKKTKSFTCQECLWVELDGGLGERLQRWGK